MGIGEDQNAGKEIEDIAAMLNGKSGSSLKEKVEGVNNENEELRTKKVEAEERISNAEKALGGNGNNEKDLSDGINALKEQVNESGKRIETLESENEKWRQQDECVKIWELAKIRMLERRLEIL